MTHTRAHRYLVTYRRSDNETNHTFEISTETPQTIHTLLPIVQDMIGVKCVIVRYHEIREGPRERQRRQQGPFKSRLTAVPQQLTRAELLVELHHHRGPVYAPVGLHPDRLATVAVGKMSLVSQLKGPKFADLEDGYFAALDEVDGSLVISIG